MTRIPCPGRHNDPWRSAEAAGQPHDYTPAYGDVRWCRSCTTRIYKHLHEVCAYYVQLHIEITESTAIRNLLTPSASRSNAPLPGERHLLLADETTRMLGDWADTIRQDRDLAKPDKTVRAGVALQRDAELITAHLEWLLDQHPDAAAGRALADELADLHRRLARLCGLHPVQPVPRNGVPCPAKSCGLAALETEVIDGCSTGYIVCRACTRLYTSEEIDKWITVAAQIHQEPAPAVAPPPAAGASPVTVTVASRPLTVEEQANVLRRRFIAQQARRFEVRG